MPGYRPAKPMDVHVPSGPWWWKVGSLIACGVVLLVIFGMWLHAGIRARSATRAAQEVVGDVQETIRSGSDSDDDRRKR